ncbi:MAG: phosphocholine cytidylyltransferase family protein [bacterium]|nr:phosphocholine cytidylyltransferase family protein [bacterium]
MRAILLAAGQATRLRPLTDNCPKCLLSIGSESILERAVRLLGERGIQQFTVVDGFCGNMIRRTLKQSFPSFDFRFIRNEDFSTTNNAWSLMLADCADNEPIFMLDSDILFEPAVLDILLAHDAPNRLGLRTTGCIGEEEMKISLGTRGQVTNITKEMPVSEAVGESVGLEVFSGEFVTAMNKVLCRRMKIDGHVNEYYEATFLELLQSGHDVMPVDLKNTLCMEIDTPEDLQTARDVFKAL